MISEIGSKNREDELNAIIGELRQKQAALQDRVATEESEKLVCLLH